MNILKASNYFPNIKIRTISLIWIIKNSTYQTILVIYLFNRMEIWIILNISMKWKKFLIWFSSIISKSNLLICRLKRMYWKIRFCIIVLKGLNRNLRRIWWILGVRLKLKIVIFKKRKLILMIILLRFKI